MDFRFLCKQSTGRRKFRRNQIVCAKTLYNYIVAIVLRCLISWDEIIATPNECGIYGYASELVATAVAFMMMWKRWFWRWIPSKMYHHKNRNQL